MYVTGALGVLFVLGQFLAWRSLRAQGLYLATNPSSSFFYVFTVTHALHLVGGICGVAYVLMRLRKTKGVARKQRLWRVFDLLALHGHSLGVSASAARDFGSENCRRRL